MTLNLPNILTLLRIALIPVLVGIYWLDWRWIHVAVTAIFVLAAITDWLDGWLARKLNQTSAFGAFLDPVADKLMVATALVLVATDDRIMDYVFDRRVFVIMIAVIIGREIVVSALREWMAELGKRASVAVSFVGKFKTTAQMVAISLLLFREDFFGIPILLIGELLLIVAAGLTLWSMWIYLRAAWPTLMEGE